MSNFNQWNSIAGHIFPIVIALFIGSWSDRRGRKLPLLLGLTGKLVYVLALLMNIQNGKIVLSEKWKCHGFAAVFVENYENFCEFR